MISNSKVAIRDGGRWQQSGREASDRSATLHSVELVLGELVERNLDGQRTVRQRSDTPQPRPAAEKFPDLFGWIHDGSRQRWRLGVHQCSRFVTFP